jgi:hypothetical protein
MQRGANSEPCNMIGVKGEPKQKEGLKKKKEPKK